MGPELYRVLPVQPENATGVSLLATELAAKRLEMLKEIAPNTSRVAMLWNDTNPSMTLRARESQDAATKLGVTIQSIGAHDLIDFDSAFASIESGRIDALLTLIDPFTRQNRQRIVDFAMRRRLPAIMKNENGERARPPDPAICHAARRRGD